jgi:transcriptional regulator of arginine metabolism
MQPGRKALPSHHSQAMSAEVHHPVSRRAAILRIIRESPVGKQDELVRLLKKQGIEATQSSVSRDLRELHVAKAGDRYIVPANEEAAPSNAFDAVAMFVQEVKTAGISLTVVKTTTGTAQSVTVAIDKARWPEVVGTISGDDTIFIATEDGRAQRKLLDRLREAFRI